MVDRVDDAVTHAVTGVAHWEKSLGSAWPSDEEDAQGTWIVGTVDEDGNKYPVITIEADQYDAPGESEKIARALIALWAQAVAGYPTRAQPATAGASHLHVTSVHEALPPNVAGRRYAVPPIAQTEQQPIRMPPRADVRQGDASDTQLAEAYNSALDEVSRLNAALVAQTEQLALVIPEECPHMIVFDDADRQPLMFAGAGSRPAALKTFEQISQSWNAHLFVRIQQNCRDDRHPCVTVANSVAQTELVEVLTKIKADTRRDDPLDHYDMVCRALRRYRAALAAQGGE